MAFTQGEYEVKVNISIIQDNKVIDFFKDINIYAGNHYTYMDVSITWEDFYTSSYRDMSLCGVYSTGYNMFEYSEEGQFLRIKSSNSNKVIVLSKV